jgi:c-di-GMP-binding flagellar brake protein YcgR
MEKERVERRKHQRFQLPTSAFAGLGPYFGKVGRILDISMGGLAFRYVGLEEPNGATYIDIFMNDLDFYLRNLQCKTISDFPVVTDGLTTVTLRRRGVEFVKMKPQQMDALKDFIEEHAIGEA